MIPKLGLVVAVGVLAAVPAIAVAAPNSGPKRDKATGGGQAFFDSREPTGAGDTVGFTAQRARDAAADSSDATGQVQGRSLTFHVGDERVLVDGREEVRTQMIIKQEPRQN